MGKFSASIERQKVKSVSASGGFAPTLLTRGSTWLYIFAKYWWQNVLSALEIFLSMRYINLHFTYLLTLLEAAPPDPRL